MAEVGRDESTPLAGATLSRALLNTGNAAMRWGRYEQARRLLTDCVEVSERHDCLRVRDVALLTLAHLDWFTGRWPGLAERAGRWIGSDAGELVDLDARLVRASLDIAVGRGAEVTGELAHIAAEAARRGIQDMALEATARLARIRLDGGDPEAALALTAEAAEQVMERRIWPWSAEIVPAALAARIAAGQPDEARALLDAFTAGLGDRDIPAARAALAWCRAAVAEADDRDDTIGRWADAVDRDDVAGRWAEAATAWMRLPRPYEAVLARERQGVRLLATGRGADGVDVLTRAAADAGALGAAADAGRISGRLRAHGVPAATVWRGGRRGYGDRLSPREVEVVRLMMTGLTNRQIADALSRSPKTVAAQLNSAMRKHGVSSRTALAVAVTQAGLTGADPA
jgi:DNA-binding CsgD family transcriptional regulator